MKKKEFYNLLTSVPKAELHLHEEAVISKATINKLYKENVGGDMSKEEQDKLFAYNDLAGFLDSFIAIQKFFTKIENLYYVTDDLESYLLDNNISYCETFFSPTSHLKKGWSFDQMSKILADGAEKIMRDTGRTIRYIVDVSRSFGLENAQRNLDLVIAAQNPYIIGIGLGGNEEAAPAKDFQSVFENAIKAGLHVVTHAGETVDSWSIKDSINLLHAERIGHGISAAYDEAFTKELAESQLPLEISPTSNTFIGKYVKNINDHPIKKLFDSGVNVTLNTDDPTFFKVSLIDEYWNVYNNLDFNLNEIKQLILNGFKASFMSDEDKKRHCSEVEDKWSAWFQSHPQVKL
ncbi:MAG: adenosine deaminase [Treponema sp.]|nr:adenosine deaminase [Treponema sp.]